MDTLNTLLAGESEAGVDGAAQYVYSPEETFTKPKSVSVSMRAPHMHRGLVNSDDSETGSEQLDLPQPRPLHRANSDELTESCADDYSDDEQHGYKQERGARQRIPLHDQRTILISNLAECTTHKDIAKVVRGGRVLDIFLRNDRSAAVSFVEGAADFLTYVKRNDVYLHAKRVRVAEPLICRFDCMLTNCSLSSAGLIVNSMSHLISQTKSSEVQPGTSSCAEWPAGSLKSRSENILTTSTILLLSKYTSRMETHTSQPTRSTTHCSPGLA
jgi:hypothetical protein